MYWQSLYIVAGGGDNNLWGLVGSGSKLYNRKRVFKTYQIRF